MNLYDIAIRRPVFTIMMMVALVVFGVLCERYVIVIPGQTNPPHLFPGMEITSSALEEGFVHYSISVYELLQALGVFGIVGLMFILEREDYDVAAETGWAGKILNWHEAGEELKLAALEKRSEIEFEKRYGFR